VLSLASARRLLVPAFVAVLAAVLLPYAAGQAVPSTDPQVGDCHAYGWKAAVKEHETSDTVNCNQAHTTRVIAVHDLPAGKSWGDFDLVQLSNLSGRYCYPRLWDALGRTHKVQDMSAYTYFWYTPTKAERQAGARWIRCDIALQAGRHLLDLPTDTAPALPSGTLPKTISRCLTARGPLTTTCSHRHAYKAKGAFTMAVKSYPGPRKLERIAVRHCGRFVHTRGWYWTTHGEAAFRQGDHVMVCYAQTRH
jgi:hypothetical protein